MRATLQQYLHEFDAAVATPAPAARAPRRASARRRPGSRWRPCCACRAATPSRTRPAAASPRPARRCTRGACPAENAALRGEVAAAAPQLRGAARPTRPAAGDAGLAADLARRAGAARRPRAPPPTRPTGACSALGPDTYAAIAYADFLIAQGRPAEASGVLKREPRTDAVLLRLAIAGSRARRRADGAGRTSPRCASASPWPTSGRRRGSSTVASRRCSRCSSSGAGAALALARGNVEQQREPLDLLLLAEAARASGDAAAIDEARRLKASLGLHDRRIDALL